MYSNEANDVDFLRSDIPWVVCTVNLLFHERAILKLGCIMNKLKVCCSVAFLTIRNTLMLHFWGLNADQFQFFIRPSWSSCFSACIVLCVASCSESPPSALFFRCTGEGPEQLENKRHKHYQHSYLHHHDINFNNEKHSALD